MRKPLLLFFLFAFALEKSTGQSYKQTATLYQTSTATSIAVTFGATVLAGDLIVVHIDWDNQARDISSVIDNKGNTYHKINGPTNWNGTNFRAELWYAYNVLAGGTKVTATLNGAPTSFTQMYITEYTGIATSINPLDQNAAAAGNTAAVSSGAKTTTYTNELIYGASIGASGNLTTGATFTTRSTANQNIIEDKNVTAAGSYSTTFTSAGGNWVAQMATFISTNSVLPVTLQSFETRCSTGNLVLDWATTSETNFAWFTIEASTDGNSFDDIATIRAVGNSTISRQYSYTVNPSQHASDYYRLKMTDLDGHFYYSKVIAAGNCTIAKPGVTLFPNPSSGNSLSGTMNAPAGRTFQVEIFDVAGKMIHRESIAAGAFQLNFGTTLPAGIYYARFVSATNAAASAAANTSVTAFVVKH